MRMATSFHCSGKASNCPNNMPASVESRFAVDHDREATCSGWQLAKWGRVGSNMANFRLRHD
jgi:hypothetical protein